MKITTVLPYYKNIALKQGLERMYMEKITITVDEVGKLLGISRPKAYELVRSKGFPAFYIGRRIVVPKDAFYKWLQNVTKDNREV